MKLDIIEQNGKFLVTKNGEPIKLPKTTEGAYIITEFDSKSEAKRYITILETLQKNKKFREKV
jgi:hypothetical protein